jgi:Flp pilus assembly protein TadG
MHLIRPLFRAGQAALRAALVTNRKGAVSLLFATALIPMLMLVGVAVDYGMYSEAASELDMAADAAAMHAARVAAQLLQQNDPDCHTKGVLAGQAWFASQLGRLPQAKTINPPVVTVSCLANSTSVTATATYSGIIIAHFGNLFPNHWPNWPNWNIGGAATAVISNPTYVEVLMLLDNSSSMMIGASAQDITNLEKLTPCSTQSATMGQTIDVDYSWAYTPQLNGQWLWNPLSSTLSTTVALGSVPSAYLPYGYGYLIYPGASTTTALVSQFVVPPVGQVGNCDSRYDGTSSCIYPGAIPGLGAKGQCTNGGGGKGTIVNLAPNLQVPAYTPLTHFPQAPCGFACHNASDGNDYWGLAKSATNPKITLRYDVLQTAARNVISKMSTSQNVSRLSVGVYQFNAPLTANAQPAGMNQVYPASTGGAPFAATEAGPVTTQAQDLTQNVLPPVTGDQPDTNFENAMALLGSFVAPSGAGNYPAAPRKNLFIVTDGMDDYYTNPAAQLGRTQAPINPAACAQLKAEGFTIYVLYTLYYPLANPFYISSDINIVEGISPAPPSTNIEYAMSQCASSTDKFYKADDGNSIDKALQAMLAAALGSAGRLQN